MTDGNPHVTECDNPACEICFPDLDDLDISYADDEDLPGFQGWTPGGTPIQEF